MDSKRRRTTIRLGKVFDVPAARLIENTLKRMGAGDRVRIDFGRVHEFHDSGIAVLAEALGGNGEIVVVLDGLRTHQVRMLRYFGIDADAFRPGE